MVELIPWVTVELGHSQHAGRRPSGPNGVSVWTGPVAVSVWIFLAHCGQWYCVLLVQTSAGNCDVRYTDIDMQGGVVNMACC